MPKPTTKEDPNVRIPNAVRAAAARADAVFNEVNGVVTLSEAAAEVSPSEVSILPDGSALVIEEAPVVTQTMEVTPQGNQQVEPTPTPTTSPTPSDTIDWKHRYESMKGRHDRLQGDMRTMSDQIANLQNVIVTMQQPAAAPSELQTARLITPEEENEFGQEFLSVVGKRAKEEVLPEVAALKSQIEQLNSRLESVTATSSVNARRNMEETLDQKVPNWREINYDENFHAWLKLPDTYSGVIRHQLLNAAYDRNDTARVLAFFTGFLAEEAAVAPAPAEPASPEQTGKIPLETLAAPGRAKTAAASSAPAEKPTFTRAQIAQFYSDSAAGKYRGREKDKDRIERQIFEAEREGRIR